MTENVGGFLGDATGWFSRNVVGGVVIGLPRGFYHGLRRAFGETPSPEHQRQLQLVNDFMRGLPASMSRLIAERAERLNLSREQFLVLCRHEAWVQAFHTLNAGNFLQPTMSFNTAATCTPENVLRSATPEQRRRMFVDYVRIFFPNELRASGSATVNLNFRSLFFTGPGAVESGADSSDFTGTFQNQNNRENILNAMNAMLTGKMIGGADVNTVTPTLVGNLAIHSLRRRYFQTDTDGNIVGSRNRNGGALLDEMVAATLLQPELGSAADMRSMLPPSFLQGAARLGILEDRDFLALQPLIKQRREKYAEAIAKTSQQLDQHFRATRLETRRNAEGLMERFSNMPILAKILLLFGAFRFARTQPGPTTAIGALLFGMYFFGRRDNPIGDVGSLIGGFSGFLAAPFRDFAHGLGVPGNAQRIDARELNRRASAFVSFLDQHARGRLEAATPLAAVADLDIDLLARTYNAPTTGTVGEFRAEDPAFREAARNALRERGLDESGISRIFADNQNRQEMNDAMGNLFFFIGSQDPANRRDAQLVERARASLPENARTYRNLPATFTDERGQTYDPQQLYRQVIRQGQQRALSTMQRQKLGDYIYGLMGMPTAGQVQEGENLRKQREALEAQAKGKIVLLNAHKIPRGPGITDDITDAKLRGEIDGENVILVLQDAPAYAHSMPIATFAAQDIQISIQQWVQVGVDRLRSAIAAGPVLPGPGGRLHVRAADQYVEFSRDNLPGPDENRAKAPSYHLFTKSVAEINSKYRVWMNEDPLTPLPTHTADWRRVEANKNPFV